MPFQPVEAFNIDEHGPVVRGPSGLQNADDFEPVVLVPVAADAVGGLDLIAQLQARLRSHDRTDHRLECGVMKCRPCR